MLKKHAMYELLFVVLILSTQFYMMLEKKIGCKGSRD